MYEGKRFVGFLGTSGTKWCKKNKEGQNVDVALVRQNGTIIWYLPESKQPNELVTKIHKNSLAEKKKIAIWRNELSKTEKLLTVVKKDSYEYFNLLHNFFWYKDALSNASA